VHRLSSTPRFVAAGNQPASSKLNARTSGETIKEGMNLVGKAALVSGSGQGIGQGIAERLAKEGANIVIDYHIHDEGVNQTNGRQTFG
jgi:hypothetical protein